MPLDRTTAKKLLASAPGYVRSPHGEFINALVKQLEAALVAIDENSLALIRAQNATTSAQREKEEWLVAYQREKDKAAQSETAIAALKDIAADGKGASKRAVSALAAMGIEFKKPEKPAEIPSIEVETEKK